MKQLLAILFSVFFVSLSNTSVSAIDLPKYSTIVHTAVCKDYAIDTLFSVLKQKGEGDAIKVFEAYQASDECFLTPPYPYTVESHTYLGEIKGMDFHRVDLMEGVSIMFLEKATGA